jgi:hypothetical protein
MNKYVYTKHAELIAKLQGQCQNSGITKQKDMKLVIQMKCNLEL